MWQAIFLSLVVFAALVAVALAEPPVADVVLAIHGGAAGPRVGLSPEVEKAVRQDMQRASRRATPS